jgi:hypothetical protein
MKNEDAIKMASQAGGFRRAENDLAPIERDDFPAPPAKTYIEVHRRKSGNLENGDDDTDKARWAEMWRKWGNLDIGSGPHPADPYIL